MDLLIEITATDETDDAIERFEPFIQQVADLLGYPRVCFGMSDFKSALVEVVKLGIDQERGEAMAVAIAGVYGQIKGYRAVCHIMPSLSPSSETVYRGVEKIKREAADKFGKWLKTQLKAETKAERPSWWRRLFSKLSATAAVDYSGLLVELVEEYFPAKDQELAAKIKAEFSAA